MVLFPVASGAFTVSGTVTDSATGKPLFRARVGVDAGRSTLTVSLGRFSLDTEAVPENPGDLMR